MLSVFIWTLSKIQGMFSSYDIEMMYSAKFHVDAWHASESIQEKQEDRIPLPQAVAG